VLSPAAPWLKQPPYASNLGLSGCKPGGARVHWALLRSFPETSAMTPCRQCGSEHTAHGAFCPRCGGPDAASASGQLGSHLTLPLSFVAPARQPPCHKPEAPAKENPSLALQACGASPRGAP